MDLSSILDEDMVIDPDLDYNDDAELGLETEDSIEIGQEEDEDSFYSDDSLVFSQDNSMADFDETNSDGFHLTDETPEYSIDKSTSTETSLNNENHASQISFKGSGFCRHRGCFCHGWNPDWASKYCKCGHVYDDHY